MTIATRLAAVLFAALLTIGCGTLRTGTISEADSAAFVQTIRDIAASAKATNAGLEAMRVELEATNAEMAEKVADIQEDIEPVAETVAAVSDRVEDSPIVDAEGNPRETNIVEMLPWLIGVVGSIATGYAAKKAGEKSGEAKRRREDRIGKMTPEEYEKAKALS